LHLNKRLGLNFAPKLHGTISGRIDQKPAFDFKQLVSGIKYCKGGWLKLTCNRNKSELSNAFGNQIYIIHIT